MKRDELVGVEPDDEISGGRLVGEHHYENGRLTLLDTAKIAGIVLGAFVAFGTILSLFGLSPLQQLTSARNEAERLARIEMKLDEAIQKIEEHLKSPAHSEASERLAVIEDNIRKLEGKP